MNNTTNPFFLSHCSPNYYFNQSTPFYFLRQQQNQQFTPQNVTTTNQTTAAYNSTQLNQTASTNENYYPSTMMFNHQEQILNNSNSSTTAHQLNSPNASFQINSSSNHSCLNDEQQMNLSQAYTAYNTLSNHPSNAHSNSTVLNSYYNSTTNSFQTNELTNSRLMNGFMNDNNYSTVNSLVSKNSSIYSTNHHLNHFKSNTATVQKTTNANLIPKHQNEIYPVNQIDDNYVTKKTVYNSLNNLNNLNNFNNTTINQLNLTNFKSNNRIDNNLSNSLMNSEHNLDLIKNSINYFNEQQQYHQCNENTNLNNLNNLDIKPKLSIYNDIRNPILYELTKNCSAHVDNGSNEFSPSALNYSTPNKLIQSPNSTGSTCSTMSSPTLSN